MIRDLRHYRLIPITPIHVGDGNELDPTQYVINGRRLERFDPVATIAALTGREKRDYLHALNEGELSQAQRILQKSASHGETAMVSLLSDRSTRELQQALENPNRRGSFKTMIRSGGRAIVPGSTLKGALRTGFLHLEFARRGISPDEILGLIEDPRRTGKASDRLQQLAFSFPAGGTERDPMRDVAVSDAAPEENATQIDQVVDWKRDRDGDFAVPDQQFQLHVERLLCLADQSGDRKIAPISVSIAVTSPQTLTQRRALEGEHGRSGPENSPNFAALLRGANAHHVAVWKRERQKFFSGPSGQYTARLLDACLAPLGMADLDTLARDETPRRALIRLGWAGHFEAKSIAAVRQGYRPQARGEKTAQFGSTRHGIVLNGVFVPFGWAALVPEEEVPANFSSGALPTAGERQERLVQGPPRRGDKVFYEGELAIIRDIAEGQARIEFDGGDIEWVPLDKLKRT